MTSSDWPWGALACEWQPQPSFKICILYSIHSTTLQYGCLIAHISQPRLPESQSCAIAQTGPTTVFPQLTLWPCFRPVTKLLNLSPCYPQPLCSCRRMQLCILPNPRIASLLKRHVKNPKAQRLIHHCWNGLRFGMHSPEREVGIEVLPCLHRAQRLLASAVHLEVLFWSYQRLVGMILCNICSLACTYLVGSLSGSIPTQAGHSTACQSQRRSAAPVRRIVHPVQSKLSSSQVLH